MSLKTGTLPERMLATSFLGMVLSGYAWALGFLYFGFIQPGLGRDSGLLRSIARLYWADPQETHLEDALRGSMSEYVSPEEFRRIQAWIREGAAFSPSPHSEFLTGILSDNCSACHGEGGDPPRLEQVEDLKVLLRPAPVKKPKHLAKVIHVHLLAIPLLLWAVGHYFVRSRFGNGWKSIWILAGFLGCLLDVASWWWLRLSPVGVWGVVLGGALLGSSLALQALLSLWDVWAPLRPTRD